MKKHAFRMNVSPWKYLFVVAAAIVIWTSIFGILDRIKDNEQIAISVYNLDCDTESLRLDLMDQMPALTEQKIKAVYVDALSVAPEKQYMESSLDAQTYRSDLFILPTSLLGKSDCASLFPEIPEDLIKALGDNVSFYEVNGVKVGILVGGSISNRFSFYYADSEPCYVFLSSYSSNLGAVLNRGKPEDDAAVKVLQYLLGGD